MEVKLYPATPRRKITLRVLSAARCVSVKSNPKGLSKFELGGGNFWSS
jgi:hypothetical protein